MRRSSLPESLVEDPFSYSQAIGLGVGPGRLRGRDLHRPFRGVRDTVMPASDVLRLATAYATRMTDRQFFSHLTAAALHGMRLPEQAHPGSPIHVSTSPGTRSPRLRGVTGHESDRTPVTLENGLRLTSPIDTWCELAATLRIDDLVIMGDGLVSRTAPQATLEQLAVAVRDRRGRRGVRKLRVALDLVRPRTDSAMETIVRLLIVRADLPEPSINQAIFNSSGAQIATGDMAYPAYRVLLEYDGAQHRLDEDQYNWDIDRLDAIMAEGWRVLRINKSHLRAPFQLADRIRTALSRAGWRP